jgi:hypothetical protein
MQTLFWIAWVILLLILLVCLYETFAVSSNSSLALPSFILSALLIGAAVLRSSHPKLAWVLVGSPVVLLLIWLLFMMTNKNWQ